MRRCVCFLYEPHTLITTSVLQLIGSFCISQSNQKIILGLKKVNFSFFFSSFYPIECTWGHWSAAKNWFDKRFFFWISNFKISEQTMRVEEKTATTINDFNEYSELNWTSCWESREISVSHFSLENVNLVVNIPVGFSSKLYLVIATVADGKRGNSNFPSFDSNSPYHVSFPNLERNFPNVFI